MDVPHDMINRYMERRKQDVKTCFDSLLVGDFEDLERTGHQLRGNGETFGFSEITHIGYRLEEAARDRNSEAINVILKEFSGWLDKHLN